MGAPLIANIVTDISNWLGDFSANWWFLIIIFVVAFLDSIVPIVPSETMVIIGGVAAGSGDQSLLLVIVCGAGGAFLGDNAAYMVGDRMSGWIEARAEQRPTWRTRLDWAEAQIKLRGGLLLITARFIPGGRTALTVSSGITPSASGWFMVGSRWRSSSGRPMPHCSDSSAARRSRTTTPGRSSWPSAAPSPRRR